MHLLSAFVPAKHRHVADLLANLREWRGLQDCESCNATEQSVVSRQTLSTLSPAKHRHVADLLANLRE